jgi:glycosyltransferase involved in cell wall biosynthesis
LKKVSEWNMHGLEKTFQPNPLQALYVTSFPITRYRRPILAALALKTLGINIKILDGWGVVYHYRPFSTLSRISKYLPKSLEWITKDVCYEKALSSAISKLNPILLINLNLLGAISVRKLFSRIPLILDIQDFNIQLDGTIPLYDLQILRYSHPELVIFASKTILNLVEKRYPKLLKRTAHIPFGIDLSTFDKFYSSANPNAFRLQFQISDEYVLTFTGAAYFSGSAEGQGVELMLKAIKTVRKEISNIKIVIQAANTASEVFHWIVKLLKNLGLEDCTILLPLTHPYHQLRMNMLKASDVLLLPVGNVPTTYYAENIKLYEYMACAKPIAMVATPARLSVLNDRSAFIAHKRSPEEFASRIIESLVNRDEAVKKAAEARKLVEKKYDWRILVPLYAKAVGKVIGISPDPNFDEGDD